MTATSPTSTPTTTPTTTPTIEAPLALRRLYLARFVFAIIWAGLFAWASSPFGSVALVLAVLYPAFDVAAAVLDARSTSATGRPSVALRVNIAVSAAAALALAVVGTGDVGPVLVVWGLWAIVSGVVQLAVGLLRRGHAGQVPMMLSGGLSVLAGAAIATSAGDATSVTPIAGYAVLGGLFFLVSALRLAPRRS